MRTPDVGISREGLPLILFSAFATLVLATLDWDFPAFVLLLGTFCVFHFFRDPERYPPTGPGLAVSPADGRILSVEQRPDPASNELRTRISIFMNVFDVHVNRSPVQGMVEKITYYPGRFLNASLDKASRDNERNVFLISDQEGRQLVMVQIAGLVARRIVCHAEPGDPVRRGQRLGLIKFGSRVDLYLPPGYTVKVHVGEKVFAGQTIVAAA
ncbi:MAG: phosphatidylserine decarboxylase family protein [Desulfohalobiaceae bacterium]|nr:phosphatidylserine decarboxylase family protein [Desulfohalobiaceae bacterium]